MDACRARNNLDVCLKQVLRAARFEDYPVGMVYSGGMMDSIGKVESPLRCITRLSKVNKMSATHTRIKPTRRVGLKDSPKTKMPRRNCKVGEIYWIRPTVERGALRTPEANSRRGTALMTPASARRVVTQPPAWPKAPLPCTSEKSRKPRAGTKRMAVSRLRP